MIKSRHLDQAAIGALLVLTACSETPMQNPQQNPQQNPLPGSTTLKVATFNVSMDATNYEDRQNPDVDWSAEILKQKLVNGEHRQIKNIAEILQRTRPDIVLLNEFDYIADPRQGVERFINHYLKQPQNGAAPLDYPYYYLATVNTGEPTGFDLDNDGHKSGFKADAFGFGFFPGHYAMVLLSKYPIRQQSVRTFQYFLWADMPGALRPVDPQNNEFWYNDEEWAQLRLSSKSHWDVPVEVNGKVLHILASHPTPPVFDGPEDRNGRRNHDEIRFWTDYISGQGAYIYDDQGGKGGLTQHQSFVIVGDQNASAVEGNARREGIQALLDSPRVNATLIPASEGGQDNRPDNAHGKNHTASWGARADYVLPSNALKIVDGGIFWPGENDPLFHLVQSRSASSDHRLVWLTVEMQGQ